MQHLQLLQHLMSTFCLPGYALQLQGIAQIFCAAQGIMHGALMAQISQLLLKERVACRHDLPAPPQRASTPVHKASHATQQGAFTRAIPTLKQQKLA